LTSPPAQNAFSPRQGEGLDELVDRLRTEGVERLRAVDRDDREGLLHLVADVLERGCLRGVGRHDAGPPGAVKRALTVE
jgi:hypothetical protein